MYRSGKRRLTAFCRAAAIGSMVCLPVVLCGCGSKSSPPQTSQNEQSSRNNSRSEDRQSAKLKQRNTSPTTAAAGGSEEKMGATGASMIRTDADGRKWFGEVPYDVWFEDPLSLIKDDPSIASANNTPDRNLAAARTGDATSDHSNSTVTTTKQTHNSTSGKAWAKLIGERILRDEVKRIRNALTRGLQSVGRYNTSYEDIQIHAATLSALAVIVIEHSGSIGWKKQARNVRDLGAQIGESSDGPGRKAFESTRIPYDQLIVALDGGVPPGLENQESNVDVSECSDRSLLMKRMQQSLDWMTKEVGSETLFKQKSQDIRHEAAILAALSKVISHESYDMADEAEYADHARGMIADALNIGKAVGAESFSRYTSALNRTRQRCDKCHADYRFGNGP